MAGTEDFEVLYRRVTEIPGALRSRVEPTTARHAFLHIAYDLPRVIAQTTRPSATDARLGQLFLEPSPLFLKAFVDFAKKGGFGLMGRLLGGPRLAALAGANR